MFGLLKLARIVYINIIDTMTAFVSPNRAPTFSQNKNASVTAHASPLRIGDFLFTIRYFAGLCRLPRYEMLMNVIKTWGNKTLFRCT